METDEDIILSSLQRERDELHDRIMQVDRIIKKIKEIEAIDKKVDVMLDNKKFKDSAIDNVSKDATLLTDGYTGYVGLDLEFFKHEMVNHAIGEYLRDDYHTNTIEGFWSQLKRMIKGTHIHYNVEYLQLYADEAAFRNIKGTTRLRCSRLF